MEPVQFNCPLCAGLFQIDPAMAGGQVLCPNCQGTVTIPAISEPPPSEAAASQLSCPLCMGVFGFTPDMAGQQVSCPHCAGLVMIPAESVPPSAAVPPASEAPAPAPYTPPVAEPPVDSASGAAPQPAPYAPAPANPPQVSPSPTNQPSAGDSRNLYPPGFEPKREKTEKQSTPSEPATAAENDYRYPPGTAPKKTTPSSAEPGEPSSRPSAAPAGPSSERAKDVSSLLPPGAPGPTEPPPETRDPAEAKAEAMLPPGAGPGPGAAPAKKSKADELLPPGAETPQEESGLKQRALPEDEKNRPIKKSKDIVIRTEDGGEAHLHEPQKTVGEGAERVRLRSLSPEEKTRKRMLKSLIMWIICVVVLVLGLALLANL